MSSFNIKLAEKLLPLINKSKAKFLLKYPEKKVTLAALTEDAFTEYIK